MILGWFIGDLAKTGYYFATDLPLQFKIGGILTVLIDFIVLAQYYYYTKCKRRELRQIDSQRLDNAVITKTMKNTSNTEEIEIL